MDIEYKFRGIKFKWNSEKERANLRKHDGIDFKRACQIFFDPFIVPGKTEEQDESRGVAIGADFDLKILFVVHLIVEDDHIRIISARKADTKERKIYEN